MHRAVLSTLVFALGCGASASGASEPAAATGTGADEAARASPGPEASAVAPPLLPETWAELEPHLTGVYVGRLEHRETGDPGILQFCEIAERPLDDRPVAGEWCGPENQPPIGFGWAPTPGAPAFILTRGSGEAERPFIVHACSGPCGELPGEAIAQEVRCHELRALQTGAHPEHQTCSVDADCAVLHAMCLDVLVSQEFASAYRVAIDRHWGDCLGAGAGMCPPRAMSPSCVEGRCVGR